jgi:hypothetical protein
MPSKKKSLIVRLIERILGIDFEKIGQNITRMLGQGVPLPGEELADLGLELGVSEDFLGVEIDGNLNQRIWAGTQPADRVLYASKTFRDDLLKQVERSLLAQETYDEFTNRLDTQLGIAEEGPERGPLGRAIRYLEHEGRLAWNTSMASANAQAGTVPVWLAILDDRTTPGCWERHGKRINEELNGKTPPRHWGCRCAIIFVPDPDHGDAAWSKMGQEYLEELADERDSGAPVATEPDDVAMLEADRAAVTWQPSRFRQLRESGLEEHEPGGQGHDQERHGNWADGGAGDKRPKSQRFERPTIGHWISPEGEAHPVPNNLSHRRSAKALFKRTRGELFKDGFIRTALSPRALAVEMYPNASARRAAKYVRDNFKPGMKIEIDAGRGLSVHRSVDSAVEYLLPQSRGHASLRDRLLKRAGIQEHEPGGQAHDQELHGNWAKGGTQSVVCEIESRGRRRESARCLPRGKPLRQNRCGL